MKILVYAPQDTFIKPIADRLARSHEVKLSKGAMTKQELWRDMAWADVVWVEWCEEYLVDISKAPFNKPIICRLHSYEVFGNVPRKVNWAKISCLVFVAPHIQEIFEDRFPEIDVDTAVVYNGVDLERFRPPDDKPRNKKLAYVGYLNYKKGPGLLMQCFGAVHHYDPEFSFHIAGIHQDPRVELYMKHLQDEWALPISYDGWVDDLPAWLQDKTYVISTSLLESFCYGIAEPAACGVIPLIHAWPGAESLYESRWLFETPLECLDAIVGYEGMSEEDLDLERSLCRQWIEDHYDLDNRVAAAVEGLLVASRKAKVGDGKITLTMIVRDEARGITRAIESAKGLVDDTLVFVDNATVDDTAELAREAGATVHIYEWEDDFSASRNRVQSEAKTEWVLVLDGHEYVEGDIEAACKAIKDNPQADAFSVNVRMEDGQTHRHPRLYKRAHAEWRNPIHNAMSVDGLIVNMDEIVVVHDRHHGQTKESREHRNQQREETVLRILSKRIIEKPEDTRSMFYLAQQHKDAKRWEAALYWYERYVKTLGGQQWDEESYTALYQGARAALYLRDLERARDFAHTATTVFMERAEAWDGIGEVFYMQGNYQQALIAFERAALCPEPTTAQLWYDRTICKGGWLIQCKIASTLGKMGRDQDALDTYESLLEGGTVPESEVPGILDNATQHRLKLGGSFDAADYWEERYRGGGNSGAGSRGTLADYKADFVSNYIAANGIKSVIDLGCGDGEIASKIEVELYTGLDVSKKAIQLCSKRFKSNGPTTFVQVSPTRQEPDHFVKHDLGLSLDVIFHLTEDEVFEAHMERLFEYSHKAVIIYSSDHEDDGKSPPHVRHREFTKWVEEHRSKDWRLLLHEHNPHPYDPAKPAETSLSSFHVYARVPPQTS